MSQQGGYSYEKELRKYTKNKVMTYILIIISILSNISWIYFMYICFKEDVVDIKYIIYYFPLSYIIAIISTIAAF